jgi:hypothetical protein
MNYILEDNFDFYTILGKQLIDSSTNYNKENENDICLISREKLIHNHISLPCNHKFNYLPLYHEIINQKKKYSKTWNKFLATSQIKCPYCRSIYNKLIPYVPLDNVVKIRGINHPPKYCMDHQKCQWSFINGKNKGKSCNNFAFQSSSGKFCKRHFLLTEKKEKKIIEKKIVDESCKKCEVIIKNGKRKHQKCGRKCVLGDICRLHLRYNKTIDNNTI